MMVGTLIRRCLFCVLMLHLGAAGASEGDAARWVRKMAQAQQAASYHGTFVYIHNGQVESMRVVRMVTKGGEYEHLVHLNGTPREVIRDNDLVTCILPDKSSVMVDRRQASAFLPAIVRGDLSTLKGHYRLSLGGKERVADLPARSVLVKPVDAYRYGYRLFIAEDGLLLRSDLLDENGQILEQLIFTELKRVEPALNWHPAKPANLEGYTWYRQDQAPQVPPDKGQTWRINMVPPGFALREHGGYQMAPGAPPMERIVLSDGLAAVSVFIEKVGEQKRVGPARVGAMNVYAAVVDDYQVTAVGEVPAATVQLIATSAHPLAE